MNKVPEGKRVYFGARRMISGDVLPPHVVLDVPVMTKKQAEREHYNEYESRRIRGNRKK
jgi:hypothetical protein